MCEGMYVLGAGLDAETECILCCTIICGLALHSRCHLQGILMQAFVLKLMGCISHN